MPKLSRPSHFDACVGPAAHYGSYADFVSITKCLHLTPNTLTSHHPSSITSGSPLWWLHFPWSCFAFRALQWFWCSSHECISLVKGVSSGSYQGISWGGFYIINPFSHSGYPSLPCSKFWHVSFIQCKPSVGLTANYLEHSQPTWTNTLHSESLLSTPLWIHSARSKTIFLPARSNTFRVHSHTYSLGFCQYKLACEGSWSKVKRILCTNCVTWQ